MSYVLLWIEILAACLLFMAAEMAQNLRAKGKWRRRILQWIGLLGPLLFPLGAMALLTGMIAFNIGIGRAAFWWCVSLWAGYLIGALLVRRRALQPDAGGAARGNLWVPRRLFGTFGIIILILLMTMWNLMLQSEIEVQALRAKAGSMALSAAAARVPESQDAAPLYEQLSGIYKAATVPEDDTADYLQVSPASPQLGAYLQREEKALALARQAADLPGFNGNPFGNDLSLTSLSKAIESEESRLSACRTAARLLCAAARHEAATGDVNQALEDCRRAKTVGIHAGTDSALINGLVLVAIDADVSRALADVLPYVTTRPQVERIRIDDAADLWRTYARCMQMEEANSLATICDLGNGNFGDRRFGAAVGALCWQTWLKEDMGVYRDYMEQCREIAGQPYYKSAAPLRTAWEASLNGKHRKGLFSAILLPAMVTTSSTVAKAEALRLGVAEARAATLCRLDHGSYPDSADALVPAYLPAIPTDPFDGKPMRFKKRDDGSMVFYAVGPDGKDDGGDVEKQGSKGPADTGVVLRLPSADTKP